MVRGLFVFVGGATVAVTAGLWFGRRYLGVVLP